MCTVIRHSLVKHPERRLLVAGFGSAPFTVDVDPPIFRILCTVSVILVLVAPNDSCLSQASVLYLLLLQTNHLVLRVLCTVICHSGAGHSERRSLAAAFGSALYVANIDHRVRSVLCTVVANLMEATPDVGRLP